MTPILIWLPLLQGGIRRPEMRSDIHRADREWDGDHVVWIVPDWTGPRNWIQEGLQVRCIPGEQLECIMICHVGENGAVVGPSAAAFPDMSVQGLLDAWLNLEGELLQEASLGEHIVLPVPSVVEGGVTYVETQIETGFPSNLSIVRVDAEKRELRLGLPPGVGNPAPVSPELESTQGLPTAAPPTGSMPVRIAWPSPFDRMMPTLSTLDDMHARALMRSIAEQSGDNRAEALARAELEARDWLSAGHSTVNRAWLQPIIATEGEQEALFAVHGQYGLYETSLAEAYQRDEWREILLRRMPVRRAWGVPGLMWALLLDRLRASEPFLHCERCGRLIQGRSDKKFCNKDENKKCYRARKRDDKRRARQSR